MITNKRDQLISLPLKFVFTEEGSTAMLRQNVQIKRLKMGDQTEHYGLFLDKISSDFLQRMIMMKYISKIEVSGVEPVESRTNILELSKLIVFSILYLNYAEVSQEQLLASKPVKQWNYTNPSLVIDEKTRFKEEMVQSFMERHTEELAKIRQELLDPIYKQTDDDAELPPDEKEYRKEILGDFLSASSPINWFVLLKFRNSPDFSQMLRTVQICLTESLKKVNIVEYSSLMLMELAVNITNLTIQKEARLLYKTQYSNIQKVIQDPNLRLPVIESLRKKNNLLTFSWMMGAMNVAIGTKGRFKVVLYDHDINYETTKESVAQSKTANVRRFNLSEFYQNLSTSGDDLELGMFYLSFLDEACNNMGIKFEAMVNQSRFSNIGQTITTLNFSL